MAVSLSFRKESIEMSERRSPQGTGSILPSSSAMTDADAPSSRGTLGPWMSTSRMPTVKPRAASAVARFTVTELLPTPPLPLMMNSLWRTSCKFWASTLFCMAAVMGMDVCPCGA